MTLFGVISGVKLNGVFLWIFRCLTSYHIDGLMQERHNSSANALELFLSCTNPSIWYIGWTGFCLNYEESHIHDLVQHCYISIANMLESSSFVTFRPDKNEIIEFTTCLTEMSQSSPFFFN